MSVIKFNHIHKIYGTFNRRFRASSSCEVALYIIKSLKLITNLRLDCCLTYTNLIIANYFKKRKKAQKSLFKERIIYETLQQGQHINTICFKKKYNFKN